MIRGLYTAASGMMTNVIRQQATTNNLANVSTPGYKEDSPVAWASAQLNIVNTGTNNPISGYPWTSDIGELNTGVSIQGVQTNLDQGSLKETGNTLDFALDGEGFFAVQTADGTTAYTRNGAWTADSQGRLCTSDGNLVMGGNGVIQLPEGEISVTEDGTISVDGTTIDKLKVVTFADGTTVEKIGNCLFSPVGGAGEIAAEDAKVEQGYLESSNVDETRAMVEMMSALRSYEMQQRVLSMQNDTLGLAVSELGKV